MAPRVHDAEMPIRVATSITDDRYYTFAGTPAGCYGASAAIRMGPMSGWT